MPGNDRRNRSRKLSNNPTEIILRYATSPMRSKRWGAAWIEGWDHSACIEIRPDVFDCRRRPKGTT